MAKKFKDRWRENGVHRQKTYATRQARDVARWKRQAGGEYVAPAITFAELVGKWTIDHAEVMLAESSQIVLGAMVKKHLVGPFGNLEVGSLTRGQLIALRSSLVKSGLAPKTVNNILVVAKRIMGFAVDMGHVKGNAFAGVEPVPQVRKAPNFWTKAERDRFLAGARRLDPEFAELVMVACDSGLRRGELHALTRGQLDLQMRKIMVDASHSIQTKRRMERTKNLDFGVVPMSSSVWSALRSRELMAMDAPVFDQGFFTAPHRRLTALCKATGVKRLKFHELRHTFASIKVMEGVPLHTVSRLLRHRSPTAVLVYAHLAPDYLADEIERGCTQSVRDEVGGGGQLIEINARI
jgi:integrase